MSMDNTTHQVSQDFREKVYKDLWQVTLSSLEHGELSEDDSQVVADFVLERLDNINTYSELFLFLDNLSNRWPIFSNIYLLIKSEETNKDKIDSIQKQLQQT
jgi:hypothetical protein